MAIRVAKVPSRKSSRNQALALEVHSHRLAAEIRELLPPCGANAIASAQLFLNKPPPAPV